MQVVGAVYRINVARRSVSFSKVGEVIIENDGEGRMDIWYNGMDKISVERDQCPDRLLLRTMVVAVFLMEWKWGMALRSPSQTVLNAPWTSMRSS